MAGKQFHELVLHLQHISINLNQPISKIEEVFVPRQSDFAQSN